MTLRKTLKFIVLATFLLLFLALMLLIKAHWQVRQITPVLPNWDTLNHTLTKPNGPISAHYIKTSTQDSPIGNLAHSSILITWGNGEMILLDTGMRPETAEKFADGVRLIGGKDPFIYPSTADQLGKFTASIKAVLFTHLHEDHTDGLNEICARQSEPITVYQTKHQAELTNHTTRIGMHHVATSECRKKLLGNNTIKTLADFPGLAAVSLGGHTPGSTLYALRIKEQTLLFSGDITNTLTHLLEDRTKGWFYSTVIVPENTHHTQTLRTWLRELNEIPNVWVLPAHDLAAMRNAGIKQWTTSQP